MTTCQRFENEALLLLEQDLPLDEHFSTCPDCRAMQTSYDRLREGISRLSEGEGPVAGWQARVWERIERRREARGRWPWWIAPAALAALLALFIVRAPAPAPSGLRVEVESSASVRRGVEAHPGDLLRLAAATGGDRHAELRVYRNDSELILRCSTAPPCSRDGGELRASIVLDGVGRYQPLLLTGQSLPASASDLDTDTRVALAAGANVELGTEVVVR